MPLFVSAGLWILALVIMGIALALKPREKERKKKDQRTYYRDFETSDSEKEEK